MYISTYLIKAIQISISLFVKDVEKWFICEIIIQTGGYDVPKGTTVLINHWALHHDPKRWEDPDKFDPTRYLDENGKQNPTKPPSWLPFSAGRRVCLGEMLAKPEILLMCANLLKRFDIRLPEGVKPNLEHNLLGFGIELPTDYKIVVTERTTEQSNSE